MLIWDISIPEKNSRTLSKVFPQIIFIGEETIAAAAAAAIACE